MAACFEGLPSAGFFGMPSAQLATTCKLPNNLRGLNSGAVLVVITTYSVGCWCISTRSARERKKMKKCYLNAAPRDDEVLGNWQETRSGKKKGESLGGRCLNSFDTPEDPEGARPLDGVLAPLSTASSPCSVNSSSKTLH